eukprot:TRINITY_DN2022_c1_g2_i1.p1 TRINITY_DN2022_c1_g2~~TRINITY_DN2022_c1_g2_i1.p1  ORF type:complete len:189 (+),score=33.49 TRINITY_DN2022_c1_g2_i1:86-568(+)
MLVVSQVPALPMSRYVPGETQASGKRVKPCDHNSWDNVRVLKGEMTLRCRECQGQWKVKEKIWKGKKCAEFSRTAKCGVEGPCARLHIHTKKQGLQERINIHGTEAITGGTSSDTSSCSGDTTPKALISTPELSSTEVETLSPHDLRTMLAVISEQYESA